MCSYYFGFFWPDHFELPKTSQIVIAVSKGFRKLKFNNLTSGGLDGAHTFKHNIFKGDKGCKIQTWK